MDSAVKACSIVARAMTLIGDLFTNLSKTSERTRSRDNRVSLS